MNSSHITRRLSEKDIRQLKYSLRPGFIFGIFMIVVGAIIYLLSGIEDYDGKSTKLILSLIIVFAFTLTWLINRKTLMDLKYGMKLISLGIISKKKCEKDYEAGSGIGVSLSGKEHAYHLKMREYDTYSLIIDNVQHYVNKNFWESVEEGEEVEIHKTKFTNRTLGFSKKKDDDIARL